jgi:hypothetical protein
VPVLAPELTVSTAANSITLAWQTPPGSVEYGFNVYRGEKGNGGTRRLNQTPIVGSGRLSFVDEDVSPGKTYVYIIGVLTAGGEVLSASKEVSFEQALALELRQNYPNPFNPATTISFTLPERARVMIAIYDADGTLVRTLLDDTFDRGVRETVWDGKDSRGRAVSSGVYFCRLKAGGQTLTKKTVLLK